MSNKLRRIFTPTKEQEIEQLENFIKICKDNRENKCHSCKYNIPIPDSEFATEYVLGSCSKNCEIFIKKICYLSNEYCEFWEDNGVIEEWNKRIKKLKEEIENE